MRGATTTTAAVLLAAPLASAAVAGVGFSRPASYTVNPEAGCRSVLAHVHAPGRGPSRKRILVPGAPGLHATALSNGTIRLAWSLRRAPGTCSVVGLVLSIGRYPQRSDGEWLPKTVVLQTHGRLTGSTRIRWFSPTAEPPDLALASAATAKGLRSRTVRILIGR